MSVVRLVMRWLVAGLPGGWAFQRLSGDLTLRAQTRGRRGGFRRARTARPMSPARSALSRAVTPLALVRSAWAVWVAVFQLARSGSVPGTVAMASVTAMRSAW
jgi:hypothetical protein